MPSTRNGLSWVLLVHGHDLLKPPVREVDGIVIPPRGEQNIVISSITPQKLSQQPADIELKPAHLARPKWNEVDADAHAFTVPRCAFTDPSSHDRLSGQMPRARCCRYQAIVRFKPSRKFVWARNPNACSARDVSRLRRGWPSGFVVSQTSRPLKPVSSAISSTNSLMLTSMPEPRLTGSGSSYCSAASTMASAASSTYKNSREACPVPHTTISCCPPSTASRHLRISAGMTCEVSGAKLSPGPYRFTGKR